VHTVAAFLAGLDVGSCVGSDELTMFPLIAREPREPHYATLSEAVAAGRARVTEISDAGSVPELRIVNDGDLPVLIIDGEELVGAKQNRIVNLTILVPAKTTLTIPVSCRSRTLACRGTGIHARRPRVPR
jgi:ARG and Rhodanese-Phosphatase-superfamily-associated Protein domain